MEKQISTQEFARILGTSAQVVTERFQLLRLYEQTTPSTEAGQKAQDQKVDTIKKWLGPSYISHEKIGGKYRINVKFFRTEVFESYEAFLARPDKTVNGVTGNVADVLPDYELDNATNQGCFNTSRSTGCVDCMDSFTLKNCADCTTCSFCESCVDCSYTTGSIGCVGLTHARNQRFVVGEK